MEPSRLKIRQPVVDEVENWDDDDFLVEGDDINLRRESATASVTTSRRRDSTSSHLSLRSDLGSWQSEDERHVHLPGDDEKSTLDAIATAQSAGIPLPKNVPPSALMGGTIKRLGGRKLRKIIHEDWENDLELPDGPTALKIKAPNQHNFPDTLRQVSGESVHSSPTKVARVSPPPTLEDRRESTRSISSVLSRGINLAAFKDADESDDFFGEGADTIKIPKNRQLQNPISLITPPTPQKDITPKNDDDEFEADLELPSDGKLKLSTRRDIPKTPVSQMDDLDWGEGSLGTRYGGTRRDGRSNRSSSASALSPSVSSSFTVESEDEALDGLILPTGPVDFRHRLQQRRTSKSPARIPEEPVSSPPKTSPAEVDQMDFFDGLDVDDGEAFDSGKLTLHRNVKLKETRPASPVRPKAAVSLTFTNKPALTRIPRLSHERTHSTSLEPVSESGGPIPQRARRPGSRMGHSAQSSTSSIPTPSTPSSTASFTPLTPRRREVGTKTSTPSLRNEPTTTSAQLLKQKRSLPAIRSGTASSRPNSLLVERPPSRSGGARPQLGIRPKTPVERQRTGLSDSPVARKTGTPMSATTFAQAHGTNKNSRVFRRYDSDNSIDLRPTSRAFSRTAIRSPSPQRYRVAADTWERLSKPKNKKNFGDGHELDGFDDLPTSRENETKFMKQPITSGPKAALRNKLYQNVHPDRMGTPSPATPNSPYKTSFTPHFARDTAASRIARETSLAQRVPSTGPLAPLTTQRVAQLSSRTNLSPQPHLPQPLVRSKKHKRPPQLKPHLISNLNPGKESRVVNGMCYNPDTYRWEGNENALNAFEAAVPSPAVSTPVLRSAKEKEVSTPRPALITNISATKGVQVVGGMVFDPQNMCWLKLGSEAGSKSETGDTMDGFNALDDDEDVFKDIPDLDEAGADAASGHGRLSDIQDDWLVGEEFDVGPEFIRRQREEEERWRKKCEKWTGRGVRDRQTWRWTIRELVSQFDNLPM